MDTALGRFDWGLALREQNDDDVVRCDTCHQAGLLASAARRDPTAPGACESPEERAAWPPVRCVFRTGCGGMMRREWLN